jgi:peptidoglycan hydrolase CwlO-like protein
MINVNRNNNENEKMIDNFKNLEKDLEQTRSKLQEQISNYQTLLKDYDVRISESIQFKQLKKLLQDKNNLIIELKNKIASFEGEK